MALICRRCGADLSGRRFVALRQAGLCSPCLSFTISHRVQRRKWRLAAEFRHETIEHGRQHATR